MREFAEPFIQKLIRIELQASAPCSEASLAHWVAEQHPNGPGGSEAWSFDDVEQHTHAVLVRLLERGLVRTWDNTPGQYEWKN
tara:strand:+ start:6985 stop:7233 length:249 start_codon:yes stop_codon:yes gene_type:complete